ncbi:hypothetical protein ACOSQ2_026120 [Xanthoceras sorbifolium]
MAVVVSEKTISNGGRSDEKGKRDGCRAYSSCWRACGAIDWPMTAIPVALEPEEGGSPNGSGSELRKSATTVQHEGQRESMRSGSCRDCGNGGNSFLTMTTG